jgi:hypothetical protein
MEDRTTTCRQGASSTRLLAAQIAALQAQNRWARGAGTAGRRPRSLLGQPRRRQPEVRQARSDLQRLQDHLRAQPELAQLGRLRPRDLLLRLRNDGPRRPHRCRQGPGRQRFRLLDAFVFHNFTIGDITGNVRLGRQVVSWGESTFIQNGINVINPVDVSALRVAGAELKEAFLPVDSIYASLQPDREPVAGRRCTCWSSRKPRSSLGHLLQRQRLRLAGRHLRDARLRHLAAAGQQPEQLHDVCFGGTPASHPQRHRPAAGAGPAGCSASFPRAPTRNAATSGQWGLALRYFASELNDTEFGFYYLRYHSRLPVMSGISITTPARPPAATCSSTPRTSTCTA